MSRDEGCESAIEHRRGPSGNAAGVRLHSLLERLATRRGGRYGAANHCSFAVGMLTNSGQLAVESSLTKQSLHSHLFCVMCVQRVHVSACKPTGLSVKGDVEMRLRACV